SPEIRVFRARGLVEVWEAAERLAGRTLPPPFWAYPWPGGAALARVLLDDPGRVAGLRVLDVGAGGGVASLAAARAGAAEVVANDQDPWALATARLAADRQDLALTPLLADLTEEPATVDAFDVVLCGDLAYERRVAPRIRGLLERARDHGARVLVADAGRAYFDETGLRPLEKFTIPVPVDLEGVEERTATVYAMDP
ncbi:MAG TPA: methyltransferase domain-containing protein, partial [Longimicrobiales bacterium]